ncbi:decaprenyl-phosphate phosphoribosyltransferase [Salinirubellus salinus]|uniref:Decaprenyl-phosphate phosphoribosyltransferase n=1 Tax=Salinirubellus salinus TaxID=1364945 RepID=A0A9E7R480_9EURY|nr:decaprenyl-phosphate phosphoribosyltransferase [Salinirubellus salinus]UWM54370.1 decaprenyl-phosphate phosphoribosyltransferase [Salinirubellus salinus]
MSFGTRERLSDYWSSLDGLVREVRPGQWYKQVILFIPVVFSMNALNLDAWVDATMGAVLFSAVAGSIYIANDIADVEEDRRHPTKRHRPIASGQVGITTAAVTAVVLSVSSLATAWVVEPTFAAILVAYVAQNLLYDYALRDVLIVDLLVISSGFVLRAIGGILLIGSPISPWLLLSTFLAALMLGSGKRWAELERLDDPAEARTTLAKYSTDFLEFVFLSVAAMLLFAYSLYTFFARDLAMMLTIPFAYLAVFRYVYLAIEGHISDPKEMLLDRTTMVNFLLWGITTLVLLYVVPPGWSL